VSRYAIYYAPAARDSLWTFGSSAIGYDAASGARLSFPKHPLLRDAPLEAWTAEPRKYGFHATLKPPFALAPGASESALVEAIGDFAGRQAPFAAGALNVAPIGAFVALTPAGPAPELSRLADACVEAFDRWGYPYVFADFRFHMTLSGPLQRGDRQHFAAAMAELYAPLAHPLVVDAIALFAQPEASSAFVLKRRFEFAGAG
jgi:2'-5' RNA ligase